MKNKEKKEKKPKQKKEKKIKIKNPLTPKQLAIAMAIICLISFLYKLTNCVYRLRMLPFNSLTNNLFGISNTNRNFSLYFPLTFECIFDTIKEKNIV